MATVKVIHKRIQSSSFGLYRTSAGGDESIIVRRKVVDPTDVMHTKSRKLARQRANLALASRHYAQLTPSQKAITRHQFEEVEYQKSHGKTDTKLLMGRQLFISNEIRSLTTTGKQVVLPYELCIMLVDEDLRPLDGELWLYCTVSGHWFDLQREEIYTGNWLFSRVPPGYPPYRVFGEADDYFDPMLPEHQDMTEDDIRPYHYHILHLPVDHETIHPNGDTLLRDLLPTGETHWTKVLEEDTTFVPPNGGGNWGFWTGNFVYKNWYPMVEQADLYTFTNPLWSAQHINRITAHCLVGDDIYPYAKCRVILKTHGQIYYSGYVGVNQPHYWFEKTWTTNPNTNEEWTRDELKDIQLGISLYKFGSFGNMMCDKISVEIHYT